MKPVPNSVSNSAELLLNVLSGIVFGLLVAFLLVFFSGCVSLPVPPKTPLCLLTTRYLTAPPEYKGNDKQIKEIFARIGANVSANPKLIGTVIPGSLAYWTCRNSSSTKFFIPIESESADKFIGTDFESYLELNAYYKKVADVMTKELNQRVGR